MDFEQLAEDISAKVKQAVAEAEERARQIIADAEREAAEIRERAEAEARERLAEVRSALDRLETSITGETEAVSAAPEPGESETVALEVDEREEEPLPEAEVTGDGEIDEAGARLVAMEMALDGEDIEAIATRLTDEFGLVDAVDVATEVHGRAAP